MTYKNLRNTSKNDEWETPRYVVEIIAEYLPYASRVWCPFDLEHSEFVKVLRGQGHNVIATHIETGNDFFETEPPPNTDYIISNPPFSRKDDVYERLYQLGIPFAMVMNLQGLFDSGKRVRLFTKYGVEIMWIYPRVNFVKDGKVQKGVIFQSGYVCKGVLPKELVLKNTKIKGGLDEY